MGTVDVFMTCSGCSFGTFMPHLRWDIAGGVSQEQVDTIDMQEAGKLIDLLLNASQCATFTIT